MTKKNLILGFTLLETMIVIGISSIILVTALGTSAQLYLSQKRLVLNQEIYTEGRLLTDRLSQIIRNSTIDYDRYFNEVGPDPASCTSFDSKQTPENNINNNDLSNRTALGYANIFVWDTNGDLTQNRNLGGYTDLGVIDTCTQAWHGTVDTLYLINNSRSIRYAVKNDANQIKLSAELGADTDQDGKADAWDDAANWSGVACQITNAAGSHDVLENPTVESTCDLAHDFTAISPPDLFIDAFTFYPSPNYDPFLAFRNDDVQIQPHVFFFVQATLKDANSRGFADNAEPIFTLQTSISSRVFGDTR